MKNLSDAMKILLCTVGALLVIALAAVLVFMSGDRAVEYETVDTAYQPVALTPVPTAAPEPEETDETEETTEESVEETTEEQSPEMDEDGFYPCDDTVNVTGDAVNVRSQPNTNCDILGSVSRGVQLHRTGYNENNWCRIEYNGQTAYISGDYVSLEG